MQDEIKSDVPNTLRTDPAVEQLVRKITNQTWIFCHDGNGIEILFADGTIVVEWDSINLVFEEVKQYGERWIVKAQKVTNAFVSNISLSYHSQQAADNAKLSLEDYIRNRVRYRRDFLRELNRQQPAPTTPAPSYSFFERVKRFFKK